MSCGCFVIPSFHFFHAEVRHPAQLDKLLKKDKSKYSINRDANFSSIVFAAETKEGGI